jgi:hypothetical protein
MGCMWCAGPSRPGFVCCTGYLNFLSAPVCYMFVDVCVVCCSWLRHVKYCCLHGVHCTYQCRLVVFMKARVQVGSSFTAAFENRSMPHFTDGHSLCTTPCICSANVCGAFVQWARPEPSFQFAAPCRTTTQGYIKIFVLNCSCCSCCLHVDCAVDSMGLHQHYTSLVLLALARHRVLPDGPFGVV